MRTSLTVLLWIPLVLGVDRVASAQVQLLLGVLTWALLAALLWKASPLLRAQTLVVVAFATVVEYVFSGWLGVYEYRLGHVPAYVPPGHGLVYLAALGMGAALAARPALARAAVASTVVAAVVLASWGLWWSPRPDMLGAFWCLCLLGFLAWGRNRLLYVGAFVAVTWLELLGTVWGVWTWMPRDTILGIVTIGNPPSVAAGGYGWFDLAAVAAAPVLLAWWAKVGSGSDGLRAKSRPAGLGSRAQQPDDLVVEQPVGAEAAA